MTDAPRVQVCPFKDRKYVFLPEGGGFALVNEELLTRNLYCFSGVEELWSGITFDPVEETLSWEAACHVDAVITLCELQDGDACQDLANSSQKYAKKKVSNFFIEWSLLLNDIFYMLT